VVAEDPDAPTPADVAAAVLASAPEFRTLEDLRAAITRRRADFDRLCREDADLTFATAHATKGLEFDHVAVIGLDVGRFPSGRALADAGDPQRALEEARRLAYVAWTRARRSLILSYDPAHPSRFLLEAFDAEELGLGEERIRRSPE
jgi:DNA helicase-2/ATP-dependent DNA helicase PcrA